MTPNVTIRVPDRLLVDFDEKIVNSRYKNRSEAVRDLMRRYVEGTLIPLKLVEKLR